MFVYREREREREILMCISMLRHLGKRDATVSEYRPGKRDALVTLKRILVIYTNLQSNQFVPSGNKKGHADLANRFVPTLV